MPPNHLQGTCIQLIQSLATSGGQRFSSQRAWELAKKLDSWARQYAAAKSITYIDAMTAVARLTLDQMRHAKALVVRAKLLDAQARSALKQVADAALTQGKSAASGLQDYFEKDLDLAVRGRFKSAYGRYVAELESKGLLDAELSGKHAEDVFLEVYNIETGGSKSSTGNSVAFEIAKVQVNSKRQIDALLVRSGELPNHRIGHTAVQTWDHAKLMELSWDPVAKKHDAALGLRKFKAIVWDHIDDLETLKGANKDVFLKHFFDNIYTNEFKSGAIINGISGEPATGSLGLLSKQRKMIFKNGASALEVNRQLGEYAPREGFIRYLQEATAHSARIQYLGANPQKNFDYVKALIIEQLKGSGTDPGAPDKATQTLSLKENFEAQKLEMAFRIAAGTLDVVADPRIARGLANTQAVFVLGAQGATILSAFTSDPFFAALTATRHGFSGMAASMQGLLGFIKGHAGTDAQMRQTLLHLGIATEGMAGLSASRFSQFERGSQRLASWIETLFKIQGLTRFTDGMRRGYAEMMLTTFGSLKDKAMSDLDPDMQALFRYHDISEMEWDILKTTAVKHPSFDAELLDGRIGDSIANNRLNPSGPLVKAASAQHGAHWIHVIEEKFARMIQDDTYTAVLETGALERKYTTLGMKSGTVLGSLVRIMSFLKSFSVGVAARHLAVEWHKGSPLRLASLVAGGMTLGYLNMLIRDTLNGKEPRELVDDDGNFHFSLITDSLQRGGVLGIWGDLFLQEYTSFGRDFTSYMAGPLGQKIMDPALSAFTKVRMGEVPDEELGKMAGLIPFNNLIGARQAIDHTIGWHLQETLFPGAKQKARSNTKRLYGQEFYEWAGPEN